MNIGNDYVALLLHEQLIARVGDAAPDRPVRTVAREGKPSRGRRRRQPAQPVIPLQRRPDDRRRLASEWDEEAEEATSSRAAS